MKPWTNGKRLKTYCAPYAMHFAQYAFFALTGLLPLLSSCDKPKQYFLDEGKIFHTSFHIKYEHKQPLTKEIEATLNKFDLSLNPFNKESTLHKVNNNIDTEVDDWFITVFNKAVEVSERSNGAFDITCAPFVNLWGFGFSKADSVTPEKIEELKPLVGYRKVHLEGRRVIKDNQGILLNMSAIAKGYSCDVVANLFDSLKIENYMVEIGGEVRAKGKNPNGICWKIEVSKPEDNQTGALERQTVLPLCNKGLATSGNYRNFYIKDGKKYAHTINPHTGYPAENDMLSATVIASDCMTADAYATAFMTMGSEAACRLAGQLPELEYYFIYINKEGNHKVYTSFADLK